ncbi:MAG: IS21 family transposase [Pirellulaceae bacterium]|nr:IS21 family transposase [Pirellulaceae bacterium]
MANVLNVALVASIQSLHAQGWSRRRIARALGVDRETVGKYVSARSCGQNPPNLPTGSDGPKPATLAGLPAPELADRQVDGLAEFEATMPGGMVPEPAANLPTGSPGPASKCEPLRELIAAKVAEGLTARRIHQDLGGAASGVGYDSVRRFIQRLGRTRPLPFRRMECAPGEEAQVDFGSGAAVVTPEGKRRRTHVFRIVLSHSRKAYSEATFTQTTEDFFRCLENAFAHFGGVPQTLVIDNLKAAVAHPDWFDPELTPKVQSFCRHYGTVILPTKPYMPRHKGKVESGVKYVKNNALKGHTFTSLEEQNRHLADWERAVADTRIHGTTKRQVGRVFTEVERAALAPLPTERFACFHEAKRKVNRDGHIEVAKAYYSVPPEYLTREVWVRWDARLVRVFNHRWEQIAVHVRHEQGRFSTHGQHLAKEKISGLERGASYLLDKVSLIGPHTQAWAAAMLTARGIEGTRVLQGLLALTKKHASETLENACETALSHDCFRLRSIRQLLQRQTARQAPLPFLDEHPLIRPLDDYAAIVARALQRQADRPSVGEGFRRHGWTVISPESAHEKSPAGAGPQGSSVRSPPRPGYPLPGCSSAEPGSVSPDQTTIVPPSSPAQEHHDE